MTGTVSTTDNRPNTKKVPAKERAALRAAVRTRMKVLRSEIDLREKQLLADVEAELAKRLRVDRTEIDDFRADLKAFVEKCNTQLDEMVRQRGDLFGPDGRWTRPHHMSVPYINERPNDRDQLRRALLQQARLKIHQARRDIDVLESDLLMNLAVDALESEQAKAFLARIPALDQLVPGTVAELEAAPETTVAA